MGIAAKQLNVTPSALSHSLRALELDLGCTLFERGGGSMKLTPAGESLLPMALKVLSDVRSLRNHAKQATERVQTSLRIAATSTACQYLLPNVLREFVESFPKLRITMDPCGVAEAVEKVLQDDTDLALCPAPESTPLLNAIPIGKDELRFLVPPAHPWTHRNSAKNIEEQTLIGPDRRSDTRKLISEHFQSAGLELNTFIETSSEEAIKQFVRLGIGIGILPEWTATTEINDGELCSIPLGRKRLTRTWVVLHQRQHRLTIAESLFTDLCRSVARDLFGIHTQKNGV